MWSPDGSRIVFMSRREGTGDLYVVPADGSAAPELLLGGRTRIPVAWSSTGLLAFYQLEEETERDIWVVDLEGDACAAALRPNPGERALPGVLARRTLPRLRLERDGAERGLRPSVPAARPGHGDLDGWRRGAGVERGRPRALLPAGGLALLGHRDGAGARLSKWDGPRRDSTSRSSPGPAGIPPTTSYADRMRSASSPCSRRPARPSTSSGSYRGGIASYGRTRSADEARGAPRPASRTSMSSSRSSCWRKRPTRSSAGSTASP